MAGIVKESIILPLIKMIRKTLFKTIAIRICKKKESNLQIQEQLEMDNQGAEWGGLVNEKYYYERRHEGQKDSG